MVFSFFHKIWFLDCDDFRNLSSWEYEEVETSQTISVLELIVMALWGAKDFNKYLHHTHTCSNLSSRDSSKELCPAKKSAIIWTAMQIVAQWYRYRPSPGTLAINPFWPEISEKTMQDGWAWILTRRKGKEVLGLVRERPQGFAAHSGAMQGSPRCSVEVEEPLAGPVESAGPGRSGEVVLYTVHRPCPSLVDIRRHLENSCPGVAEGNMQPVSSVGKKGRQGERENALKGLSTREMVCSQEYSLQGKTKKCPLRFSSSFKKNTTNPQSQRKSNFFALSGNNGCLLRRSDPGTPADLRGLWVRCQDGLKPEIFSSLPHKAEVQPATYPLASPEAARACFSSSRAAAGEGTGIQQTFHRGHGFRN